MFRDGHPGHLDFTSEKVTGHDQAPIADTVMPMATRPPVAAPVRRLSGWELEIAGDIWRPWFKFLDGVFWIWPLPMPKHGLIWSNVELFLNSVSKGNTLDIVGWHSKNLELAHGIRPCRWGPVDLWMQPCLIHDVVTWFETLSHLKVFWL